MRFFLNSDCGPQNFLPPVNQTYFLPDSLMAARFTPLHPRGDSGPPVCPCNQLRNCQGSAAETRHNSWVCYLSEAKRSIILHASREVRTEALWCTRVYFRVLLSNANELIEMQMRNDSTDPRSSSTFYERYHSLEDVCFSYHIPAVKRPIFNFKVTKSKIHVFPF